MVMAVRGFTLSAVMPAQAGIPLAFRKEERKLGPGLRRGDANKGEFDETVGTSRALAPISFSRILIGPEATAETVPPFFFSLAHGPP